MIFLISPSKTMDYTSLTPAHPSSLESTHPLTTKLLKTLESSDFETLKSLYKSSDKVTNEAIALFQNKNQYKAIELFNGAVFKNIGYSNLDESAREYINSTVKIFSALYGIIQAKEPIRPYRLDLNNTLKPHFIGLSSQWKEYVKLVLADYKTNYIIDLSSTEYNKLIDKKSLYPNYIHIDFKEEKSGKYKTIGTYAKMARGQFIRACALDKVHTLGGVKKTTVMNYTFNDSLSDECNFIFTR